MVKMACFSWKPRRHSESDQKLLEDVMPNGVADLDQNGNAIPGGLAGIRQRMAAMGHTMNPHPVEEEPENAEQDESGNNADAVQARRQRKMPAQGDENVNGNSDGGFSLSAEVCTEDGQSVKANVGQPKRKPPPPARTQSDSAMDSGAEARAIVLAGPEEDENSRAAEPSHAIILGPPPEPSNNVIVLGAPEPDKPSEVIVLGGPPADQEQQAAKPADVILLGPPPEKGDDKPKSGNQKDSLPWGVEKKAEESASVKPSEVRKLNFGGSKKRQENFLLQQASIETAKQDTEAEKRALGNSTSNLDAVVNYFPGRDEVQKHLQVLSPGYQVNLDDSRTDIQDEGAQQGDAPAEGVRAPHAQRGEQPAPMTPPTTGQQAPKRPHVTGSDRAAVLRSEAPATPPPPRLASAPKASPPSERREEREERARAGAVGRRAPQAGALSSAAASPNRLDTTALSSHSIRSSPSESPPQPEPRTPPPPAPAPAPAGDNDPDHLRVSPLPRPETRPEAPRTPSPRAPHPQPALARPPAPPAHALPPATITHAPPSALASSAPAPPPRAGEAAGKGPRQSTLLPALQPKAAPVTPVAALEAERRGAGTGAGPEGLVSPRSARSPAMGVDRGRDLILENIIAFRCEQPEGAFHDWLVKLTPDDITEAIMRSSKGTGIWRELWDSVSLDLDGLQD